MQTGIVRIETLDGGIVDVTPFVEEWGFLREAPDNEEDDTLLIVMYTRAEVAWYVQERPRVLDGTGLPRSIEEVVRLWGMTHFFLDAAPDRVLAQDVHKYLCACAFTRGTIPSCLTDSMVIQAYRCGLPAPNRYLLGVWCSLFERSQRWSVLVWCLRRITRRTRHGCALLARAEAAEAAR